MAFNLKVYQIRHYPFQHPYLRELKEGDHEMRASCDEQYTDHKESPLDKKAMDEKVHQEFLKLNLKKKLDLL